MQQIIRVNMTHQSVTWEDVPQKYQNLGGRALTSAVCLDEVAPLCDPLGPNNKLVIAPGILGGFGIPCGDRLSVGAKSPLTGGIKESNAGGTTGAALAKAGIKALIIEGKAPENRTYVLEVTKDGAALKERADLKGLGNYRLAGLLREEYGEKSALMTIGPTGERAVLSACISNVDAEGRPSRVNGRGGLGAVMGSKGLKAVIIRPDGARTREVADKKAFTAAVREFARAVKNSPVARGFREYGTAANVMLTDAMGCLPTRNFSQGSFEGAQSLSGEEMRQTILARGGQAEHRCMPGCVIQCSNVFVDQWGREVVAPLEYETIGLLGSNCGIASLDAVARLNFLCNDIGVDTIETGAAIGVAMEGGVLSFGDLEGAAQAISGIATGTTFGLLLGAGAAITGKVLNVQRVPAVKGQAMPAYDPRSLKGVGVTYATSPQGADHTAGHTLRAKVDHCSPENQVEASFKSQVAAAFTDALGLCNFAFAGLGGRMCLLTGILQHVTGAGWEDKEIVEMGKETLRRELRFNMLAGLGPETNDLPEYMRTERLEPRGTVFDVEQVRLKEFFVHLVEKD